MIITCPACTKRYQLKDGSISSQGRRVKCIACAHVWHQLLEETPNAPHVTKPLKQAALKRRTTTQKLVWCGLGLLVTLGIACAYIARDRILARYPVLQPLYSAIGLSTSDAFEGIDIHDAKTSFIEHKGQKMVRITGEVINVTTIVMPAPLLYIKAIGACADGKKKDCEVGGWEHKLSKDKLSPGEHLNFETDPRPVPPKAERLAIQF